MAKTPPPPIPVKPDPAMPLTLPLKIPPAYDPRATH